MCGYSVFLSQKQQEDKTLITKKKRFLYPPHRIHNGLQKRAKNFLSAQASVPWTKAFVNLPLFGSSRVINRIKSCLTTIFHGIKFIHYHLYSEIPCNFLLYINYHIICQNSSSILLRSLVFNNFIVEKARFVVDVETGRVNTRRISLSIKK